MNRRSLLGALAVVGALLTPATLASGQVCQAPPCGSFSAADGSVESSGPTQAAVTSGTVIVTPPPGVQPADRQNVFRRGSPVAVAMVVAAFGITVLLSVLTQLIRRRRRWISERPQPILVPTPEPVREADHTHDWQTVMQWGPAPLGRNRP